MWPQFQRLEFGIKRMLISISTDIEEKWFVFYEHSVGNPSFICVYLDYFLFITFFFISFAFVISFFILLLNRKLREIKLRSVVE